jgi:hypothetical protein
MLGPAVNAGLEERTIDDQLTTAFEQIDEAGLAVRAVEDVSLLDRYPRHTPSLGSQRVARARQRLLLHQELLARRLPLLR